MATPLPLESARAHLKDATRLLVVGCSGSGKSALARALAARLGLRHISMDREIFWLPGWKERPREEALDLMKGLLAEDRWVMDGSSPGTLHLRLPRTHLVIWVRPSRWVSLRGALTRFVKYFGRTRPEMADNCPEKIDFEFLHYIWTFETYQAPRLEQNLEEFGPHVPVLTLRSHAEMNRLLTMLESA